MAAVPSLRMGSAGTNAFKAIGKLVRPARLFDRLRVLYFLLVCDTEDTACGEDPGYISLEREADTLCILARAKSVLKSLSWEVRKSIPDNLWKGMNQIPREGLVLFDKKGRGGEGECLIPS